MDHKVDRQPDGHQVHDPAEHEREAISARIKGGALLTMLFS
jgi:hypothetical protein